MLVKHHVFEGTVTPQVAICVISRNLPLPVSPIITTLTFLKFDVAIRKYTDGADPGLNTNYLKLQKHSYLSKGARIKMKSRTENKY
jgi:hypothetical protein